MTEWFPAQLYADEDDFPCACSVTNENVLEWAFEAATRRVFKATEGKYPGILTSKIRPTRRACSTAAERTAWISALARPRYPVCGAMVDGEPLSAGTNVWACMCGGINSCTCLRRDWFRIPYRPVIEVTGVMMDGEEFTDWQMIGSKLYRTDEDAWPACQAPLPDTELGTWSITVTHGTPFPSDGRPLVALYACELAKRACKKPCDLPEGVKVVARGGVEFAIVDNDYQQQNLTGFPPLDDWIVNDRGGLRRATIRPGLWTARRAAQRPSHRLDYTRPLFQADQPVREVLTLWEEEDFDREVAWEDRVITEGELIIEDPDGANWTTITATITAGEAHFHVTEGDWPTFPAESTSNGRYRLRVKIDGAWELIQEGPVDWHKALVSG